MKKLKQILTLIIALVLCMSLAACSLGNKGTEADAQTEEKKEEAKAEEKKEEVKEEAKGETAALKTIEELAAENEFHLTTDELPIIDGATLCFPFYENMVSMMLNMPIEKARTYVLENTTTQAYEGLAKGDVDMIFCLHASEDQTKEAAENGVTYEYVPYSLDAFVFFVNKDNPVDSITMDQLKGIYNGTITNWKELGGNDAEILAFQRSEGSGSQTGLYQYVIPQDEVVEPPTEQRIGDMGGIVDAVSSYDNGKDSLGYSYLYFVTNQHYDDQIKILKVEGYEPNKENIQSRAYPMITEICTVFNSAEPEDSVVRQIASWCTSEIGQTLAEDLYYVPVK